MNPYIRAVSLRTQTPGDDDSSPTDNWELLASAVSRLFDRECKVSDGFFLPAGATSTAKTFRATGTPYVQLLPYIAGSMEELTVDGSDRFEDGTYYESEGYLIFDDDIEKGLIVSVTAKWGFTETPKDIEQACIEQALLMWRRKDLSFADLSGVSSSVVTNQFSPTFMAVTWRYRGLYGQNDYFA